MAPSRLTVWIALSAGFLCSAAFLHQPLLSSLTAFITCVTLDDRIVKVPCTSTDCIGAKLHACTLEQPNWHYTNGQLPPGASFLSEWKCSWSCNSKSCRAELFSSLMPLVDFATAGVTACASASLLLLGPQVLGLVLVFLPWPSSQSWLRWAPTELHFLEVQLVVAIKGIPRPRCSHASLNSFFVLLLVR